MRFACTALFFLVPSLFAQVPAPQGAPTGASLSSDSTATQSAAPPASAVALFYAAHTWDMAFGALAAQHGSIQAVRDVGKLVARDDSILRDQEVALAKKFDTPVTPMGKEDQAKLNDLLTTLQKQRGKDFDTAMLQQMHDFEQGFVDGIDEGDKTPMGQLLSQTLGVWKAHITQIDPLLGANK